MSDNPYPLEPVFNRILSPFERFTRREMAGGMLFPVMIYLAFNLGTPAAHGWSIPTATDIATLRTLALRALRVCFRDSCNPDR